MAAMLDEADAKELLFFELCCFRWMVDDRGATKAQRKEERLVNALEKIKPPSPPTESKHDPEILTPEEHFYFLNMGNKCKNCVPVGRRGIFQGVILNMHLHWKKHETLKVIVKIFTPEEVKEIAAELAQLSGGIVLDVQEGNTIIMYRGKNYSQPPPEIMSPRVSLSRKKALDKSKFRDALRAARIFIPRLEHQLEALQASACNSKNEKDENKNNIVETCSYVDEFHDDAIAMLRQLAKVRTPCIWMLLMQCQWKLMTILLRILKSIFGSFPVLKGC